MYALVVILILSGVGFYLYKLYFRRDVYHGTIGRRSGKDRRKKFIASKNSMRRSDKDRRQSKG